jgi:hypothetical protein
LRVQGSQGEGTPGESRPDDQGGEQPTTHTLAPLL